MMLVYLGLGAVVVTFLALPVAYWWLERDGRPQKERDPFEVQPRQRRMPYDSGSVDYRRS